MPVDPSSFEQLLTGVLKLYYKEEFGHEFGTNNFTDVFAPPHPLTMNQVLGNAEWAKNTDFTEKDDENESKSKVKGKIKKRRLPLYIKEKSKAESQELGGVYASYECVEFTTYRKRYDELIQGKPIKTSENFLLALARTLGYESYLAYCRKNDLPIKVSLTPEETTQVILNVKKSEWPFLSKLLQKFDFVQVQPTGGDEQPNQTAATTATEATTSTDPTEDKQMKAKLVERLWKEFSYLDAQIVDKCFTFKLSPTCWNAITGFHTKADLALYRLGEMVVSVLRYCKSEGIGNLFGLSPKEDEYVRMKVDEIIKNLRNKFSLTIEAPVECRGEAFERLLEYPKEVLYYIDGNRIDGWSPKSGEAHITVILSPTGDEMDVKISPDGKQFTITGPAYESPGDIYKTIYNSLERVNKNQ